ncbi:pyridoxal phosphate-dependent transferase [Gautieria morchelliformis]|nr:pyridoxal phosphate-dependent transferase [Gautieria morchelliformis]
MAASLVQFGQRHVTRGVGRMANAVIASGKGSHVQFQDGRKLLDFTCGIGVTSLGHCHPKVSRAAAEQCMKAVHIQCSIAFHEPYLRLVEKLLPVMPHPSLDSFFFWNSGSEAVEAAIKLARTATGRQNIIAMQGGYHGRTYGSMAVTSSKTIYSQGIGPLMPGAFFTAFPYWHQHSLPMSTSEEELSRQSLWQLDLVLSQQTRPQDTAAIILEPILGEGGYVPAPTVFLQGLRDVCDKHGMLLIIDEVQSGFGRTGKYFAIEHSKVRPDIMVMAKGIANGFPLSGIVSSKALTDTQAPGSVGGTYAGNAVSCAAGVACAEVMQEENILANVQARSSELFESLNELLTDPKTAPYIAEVRGRGLMVGVEFRSPGTSPNDPASDASSIQGLASKVSAICQEKGLLIMTTSMFQVVRFIPALTISKEELAQGVKIFKEAIQEAIA